MDFIKLTNDKLSVEEANDKVKAANCGAISLFVGTTRDNFEDKKVVNLEYEAYEPMAKKAIKEICSEIREKWKDVENIAIYHRLGQVPVSESSVIIAISSPHRNTALEATSHCIEVLKKSVPIWKKEVYADGAAEATWKENAECPWSKYKPMLKPRVEVVDVPSHLIQITCSKEEMRRRIETFMARKREQANRTNIRDFCGSVQDSCARVAARLKRHTNSKSHLRMQRVYNTVGPYINEKSEASSYVSSAVEGRVKRLELSLGVSEKPVAPDIYQRLRTIEDKILFLESVSPEYKHFWNTDFMDFRVENKDGNVSSVKKKKYDIHEVDSLLYELEKQAQTNN